jgi:hypothetical protein
MLPVFNFFLDRQFRGDVARKKKLCLILSVNKENVKKMTHDRNKPINRLFYIEIVVFMTTLFASI